VRKSRLGRALVLLIGLVAALSLWLRHDGSTAPGHGEGGEAHLPPAGTSSLITVDFRDDADHGAIAALGAQLGVAFRPGSALYDTDEIYVAETSRPEAVLAQLRARADVEAADYQIEYRLPELALAGSDDDGLPADGDSLEKGFPNDPKYKFQWHLQQIHSKETWKAAQGAGVIVAVIDTGVTKVPDLAGTEIVAGYNFVDDSTNAADDHGHGTHVAGTIAQSTHNALGVAGVAFKAKIMPIKVLSARGSGSVSGIASGIRFAADHGAKVINMSLGGGMSTSVLANAVKYAHDKGVTVICAAGNDGAGKVSYPAAYKHAVAVAATQFDETTTFYSNWGKEIDVAGPGGNTRVDQNGDGMMDGVLQNTVVPGNISKTDYLLFMGTSMAAPHVAGVAALIVGAGVTDPDAVEDLLKDTARKPKGQAAWTPTKGPENRYGAGIVDASAAVKKAQLGQGGASLGVGAALAGLLLLGLRRKALLAAGLGVGGVVALVLAAGGLFFLPALGVPVGSLPGATVLTGGLPALDQAVLGAAGHGNPLLYSAIAPLLAVLVLYGKKNLRGLLAGLAIGWAANLVVHALFRTVDIRFVPNVLDGLWLGLNAAVLAVTARFVLRK
jgi:serine protease